MKFLVIACFAAGVVIGWGPAGKSVRMHAGGGGSEVRRANREERPDALPPASRSSVRLTQDRVELSRAELEKFVNLPVSPALSFKSFPVTDTHLEAPDFANLATWCQLDAREQSQLAGILQKAAAARRAWEKENVKVTSTGPAAWTVEIPGDGGQALAALRQQLAAAFPPTKAAAIEAGGDLQNFFTFRAIPVELQQGRVEVSARRVDANREIDPAGNDLVVSMQAGENNMTFYLEVGSIGRTANDLLASWLPGTQELLEAATAAARAK